MRVLALDTTTPRGSLAVASEDGVLAEARLLADGGHSRWVLGAAEALLQGLGLAPAALDGFAVTVGPGSFTGLRVGLSTIQGLALAASRPCVGLSTLEVLALAAEGRGAGRVVPLLDAFRGETYAAVYDGEGRALAAPRAGALDGLLADPSFVAALGTGKIAFVGDVAVARRAAIAALMPGAEFPDVDPYLAPVLARAAVFALAEGKGVPPAALRPLYLRGADARLPRP